MINLNKKIVTKKGILCYIQDIDVYRFYTGKEVNLVGNMKSPLREDKNPSFGYFQKDGEILFNDFRLGGGDFVKFVMMLFGITYFEALSKIVIDFNLKYHFHYKNIKESKKEYNPDKFKSKEHILQNINKFSLKKKRRKWKIYDYKFWIKFGITIDTLTKYNVEPVNYIFLNGRIIKCDKYAYCFIETKDNKETYKIYQPFNNDFKWLNNHNDSVWQGWEQLPNKGNDLIITKSLKDVMSIYEVLNIPSISLQSESVIPKDHIIEDLKERFKTIYLLYDNDYDSDKNWGRMLGKKICNKFNLIQLEIDDQFKSKDFSDLVKKYGKVKSKEIFNKNIKLPF